MNRPSTSTATHPNEEIQRLETLILAAARGNQEVLPELREALDRNPVLWRHAADLDRKSREQWIHIIAGINLLMRESLAREVQRLEAELLPDGGGEMERLLVARVLAAWLQTQYAERKLTAATKFTPHHEAEMLKRVEAASYRFGQAMKMLATVRKLLGIPAPVLATEPATEPLGPQGVVGGEEDEPEAGEPESEAVRHSPADERKEL